MADVQPYINDTLNFARTGFSTVNVALGLIVAIVAAFMTNSYRQLFVISIGSTLVTIVAEARSYRLSRRAASCACLRCSTRRFGTTSPISSSAT